MMVSPAKAEMVSPFSLNSIVSAPTGLVHLHAIAAPRAGEVLRDAADRIGRRLPEAADRRVGHRDRELFEQRVVPLRRFHQLRGLGGADAARRALAARLVLEEAHQVQRRVARLVVLREDDHRRRADEAAVGLQRVEVERDVAHRGGQDAARGSAPCLVGPVLGSWAAVARCSPFRSIAYVIGDAAFIHDTIFMPDGGTARADFPGGSARVLWNSIQRIMALPDNTHLFTGHDYMPGGREPRWESTVAQQHAENIHLIKARTEEEFVALREKRDRELAMPKLILHALQVNIRGGRLPEPESNGKRYLKIPLNALEGAAWDD